MGIPLTLICLSVGTGKALRPHRLIRATGHKSWATFEVGIGVDWFICEVGRRQCTAQSVFEASYAELAPNLRVCLFPYWVVDHVVLVDCVSIDAAVQASPVANDKLPPKLDTRSVAQVHVAAAEGMNNSRDRCTVLVQTRGDNLFDFKRGSD